MCQEHSHRRAVGKCFRKTLGCYLYGNDGGHTFRNHPHLLHGRLVGCIGLVGCRRQRTQQAAQRRSCQIVSDLKRSGVAGKNCNPVVIMLAYRNGARPLVWCLMPGRQQTLLPQAQERTALEASPVTAAELPLQQRLVALLSARQLLLMYCLERTGTVYDKSVRSQTKFHTSLAPSDQPAVLARAAICSSVNPFAAPGAFARSKPGDEGAGSCSMFISPAAATAAAAAAILVRTANEMCKWEMAEPAELAAVPLANLPLRRWRHQRRRPQPKPDLLRSCQAHYLKKS